jgi:hypothetical protein
MVFNCSAKTFENRFLNRSNIFSIEVFSKGDCYNKPNSILNHEQTKIKGEILDLFMIQRQNVYFLHISEIHAGFNLKLIQKLA